MSSAYHPESDGATERANRTDWVAKLPAIEFAINLASSKTTLLSPFKANTGRTPRAMVWNNPTKDEYPSMRVYLQKMKSAQMAAHDSMLEAHVKQTRQANRRRQLSPFKEGDLAYVSTKNMMFPKGLTRKLIPNSLVADAQVLDFGDEREPEWAVSKIRSHTGAREEAMFEVEWRAGDVTWLPYASVSHLDALNKYLDLLGLTNINSLTDRPGTAPREEPRSFSGSVSLGGAANINTAMATTLPTPPPHHQNLPSSSATHIPSPASTSWFDDHDIPLYIMTVTQDEGHLAYFSGHGRDILIRSPHVEEESHLVTRDQLKLFISYSHALHNKSADARPPSPLGYKFFTQAFNSEGLASSASYVDELGTVISTGSALELADILGDEDEAEITLLTTHMAQVKKMVWHMALNAQHQRERMDMCRAAQKKEKNYGRKQEQKLNKKGLGKINKVKYVQPTNAITGSSTAAVSPEDPMDEVF
ncbi:hypothetical protein EDD22DRAFT_955896 [Suillus occidentalis]|nr:hypothetical protein EDD22DRAFT_955896 [Suillus occidentalis]